MADGDDATDFAFRAEYAKSSRASCRACKGGIEKGTLRLAALVQSPLFDGKMTMWYHFMCFFGKQRPKSVSDIAHFEELKFEDQEKIRKKIADSGSNIAAGVGTTNGKSKGAKRPAKATITKKLKGDFKVEYSKSSRAACRGCHEKIVKDEIRISKKDFETPEAKRYGGMDLWHHLECFVKLRTELEFSLCGDTLPGFSSLKKEDKSKVIDALPEVKLEGKVKDEVDSGIPSKKIKKEEVNDELDKKRMKNQSDKLFEMKRLLEPLEKKELVELLEYNKQQIPVGTDRIIERLQDIMTFGVPAPCTKCSEGQFVFRSGYGYMCQGTINEWVKCEEVIVRPSRTPFKLPKKYKDAEVYPGLSKYKFGKVSDRIMQVFKPAVASSSSSSTNDKSEPKVTLSRKLPLKNMDFFLYKVGDKNKIKKAIEMLGGHVISKLHTDVAAVVSTEEEVERHGEKMDEIESLRIQVVNQEFFEKCKNLDDATDKIVEFSISPWGSDPSKRIKNTREAKSAMKSAQSSRSNFTKSGSSKIKVKAQSGTAVDPDSGLQDEAHIYRQGGEIYMVTLGCTDVQAKKNSYYKLQVLESNKSKRYWLFRSWGRIGTTIGGNKLDSFMSVDLALKQFRVLYEDKTGNMWENHKHFEKVPGKMYPLSVDYGDGASDDKQLAALDATGSKLKKPIQDLIMTIFDVDLMKKTMVEFEIDLEKMPLGKISKSQILKAYSVLTELQAFVKGSEGDVKPKNRTSIIEATNRFFTLVPHSFGIADPPILDNEDIIKNKIEMLDSLLEMEVAFSIMHSSQEGGEHSLDTHYTKLNSDIDVVERESSEFVVIQQYVKNTHAKTHSNYELEIVEAFKVTRKEEEKRFKPFKKLHNRKLLWHGSRLTNFAGILSQGLRIAPPEAPVTGYMFGKGIYFADMVSKSANYCYTSPSNNVGLLMLCEVALGEMYERTQADYIEKLPKGYHSCKGIGGTHPDPASSVFVDDGRLEVPAGTPKPNNAKKSSLLYNEYIVYDVAQVKVKYLLQLDFKYKY